MVLRVHARVARVARMGSLLASRVTKSILVLLLGVICAACTARSAGDSMSPTTTSPAPCTSCNCSDQWVGGGVHAVAWLSLNRDFPRAAGHLALATVRGRSWTWVAIDLHVRSDTATARQ